MLLDKQGKLSTMTVDAVSWQATPMIKAALKYLLAFMWNLNKAVSGALASRVLLDPAVMMHWPVYRLQREPRLTTKLPRRQ